MGVSLARAHSIDAARAKARRITEIVTSGAHL
jgi:formate-dependent phosphoribosylglycinamide formyltransferase (GAR transformylase)